MLQRYLNKYLIFSILLSQLYVKPCLAEQLYIVEGERGILTFTNRKPKADKNYRIAKADNNYSRIKSIHSTPTKVVKSRIFKKSKYHQLINKVARENQLRPALVKAVIHAESAFNERAVSHKGAIGLMQLMPATAKRFGEDRLFDPKANINTGSKYLRLLIERYEGNLRLALAAYNAGEGAVDKYSGIPPYKETINYVEKVTRLYRSYACHDQGRKSC